MGAARGASGAAEERGVDPARRDAQRAELARMVAEHLDALLDTLVLDIAQRSPGSGEWPEEVRETVRSNVRQMGLGFLRFLRVGDLEAYQCQRLRRLIATPVLGQADAIDDDLPRSVRMDAVDVAARLIPLSDDMRRLLDRELEAYLNLLRPGELRLGEELGALDTWLARIEAEGVDIA